MKCRVCVSLQNICRLRFTLMSVASSLTPLCKDDLLQASCSEWRDRKAKAHVRTDTHKHKHKAKRKHKQRSKHKHDHKHNTHTHTTHERAQATSDKHTVAGVRASTCYNKVPSSYLGEARYAKCTTHIYRRSWLKRMAHVVCFLCQFGIIAGSVAW